MFWFEGATAQILLDPRGSQGTWELRARHTDLSRSPQQNCTNCGSKENRTFPFHFFPYIILNSYLLHFLSILLSIQIQTTVFCQGVGRGCSLQSMLQRREKEGVLVFGGGGCIKTGGSALLQTSPPQRQANSVCVFLSLEWRRWRHNKSHKYHENDWRRFGLPTPTE